MSEPKLDITVKPTCEVTDFIHVMAEVMGKPYGEVESLMFREHLYPEGYETHLDAECDTAKPFTLKAEAISYMKRHNIAEVYIKE